MANHLTPLPSPVYDFYVAIFIGLDSLGKTSLLKLCQDVEPTTRVIQLIPDPTRVGAEIPLRKGEQEVNKWEALRRTTFNRDLILLYDHFPQPDDYVYQEFTARPKTKHLTDKRRELLEKRMTVAGAKIVYFEPDDWPTYAAYVREHPDTYIPDAHWYMTARRRYDEYMKRTQMSVKRITGQRFFFEQDAIDILRWIRARD